VALIVLIAPAGHAGAQAGPEGWVHLVADAAHLLAAAAWLGGLPALAMYLGAAERDPQRQGETAARLTARFSWLGIACVGTLIASGVINSYFLLSGPGDLLSTTYGRVLALKLGLFAAMLAIAAANRFYLTPRLRDQGAARSLRRNSLIEVCLGAGVLLFVAILGTLEPGGHHHDTGSVPEDAAFVHIHTSLVMADVTVEPGRAGLAEVRIHLSREDFSNYPARGVRVELRPPEAAKASIVREAKQTGDGIWKAGDVDLWSGGIWTVLLSIVPTQGNAVVLDAPIVISP
jgi:putative copper resistance protein D